MKKNNLVLVILFLIVIIISVAAGALGDRIFGHRILDKWLGIEESAGFSPDSEKIIDKKILKEESVVIDVVEQVSPSVITIGIKKTQQILDPFESFFGQDDFFNFFPRPEKREEQKKEIEQNIGSGFIVSEDGMIVTNKHVVSDPEAEYKVISKDGEEYKVEKIYRDPVNDLAILKINPSDDKQLVILEMGNSDELKVGQFVVAIGTAFGEFSNTVTTGVISGLGRGITAGGLFQGLGEQLDNVIQTDAAINPGNSGGPLLNSLGQAIGVNVAVSAQGENIGFALPISLVKESLDNFNKTGKFERAFLGVRYKLIEKELALLNEVPQGAYIVEIIKDSPAEKGGIEVGDIIMKIDGQKIEDKDGGLAEIINSKKVGDTVEIEMWREGKTSKVKIKLEEGE